MNPQENNDKGLNMEIEQMEMKGPKFLRFYLPVIEVLGEMGGSASASEVIDQVIEKMQIPEKEQNVSLKSGALKIRNQVQWAKQYLVWAGYIDASKRGIWSLTEKGLNAEPASIAPYSDFLMARKKIESMKKEKEPGKDTTTGSADDMQDETPFPGDYGNELIDILKSLSPYGFERLCQRLLRESGFEKVVVTGKSGDGGIDGHGILQVNPFVSFTVMFQCKRYQGSVSSSHIRDFRGAMMGRTDKGIIITTGSFTTDAKKEAMRDGVPPIELVDGEKLVALFESLELGLKPRKTYDIDYAFFDLYQ